MGKDIHTRLADALKERDRLKRKLDTLNADFERVVGESNRHREVLAGVANVVGKRLKETEE